MGKRLVKGELDLDDFLKQLQQIKKMGPLTQILDMIRDEPAFEVCNPTSLTSSSSGSKRSSVR